MSTTPNTQDPDEAARRAAEEVSAQLEAQREAEARARTKRVMEDARQAGLDAAKAEARRTSPRRIFTHGHGSK